MAKDSATPRPRLHRNIWVFSLTSFLTDVSSEMLFNLLPLFLLNVLGVRTAVVGVIEGVAETTSSLLKVASGALSDRLGERKNLAVLGYGLSALSKPFLYFASTWGWVLGVRFSDRVGKGVRTAPRDALLAGSVRPENRGLAFGLHRAADTGGAFTGLAIAALIVWFSQSNLQALTRSTFQLVVIASLPPAFLAVLILSLGAREVRTAGTGKKTSLPRWSDVSPRLKAFLGIVILFTLGNSSDAFLILRAQERGLSVLQVMGMLMTFNAIYALLASPAGLLSDRIGRFRLVLAGWSLYALIYLGFALAQSGVQAWVLYALYGAYYGLTEGVVRALIADLTPPEQRGTAYGLYHASVGLTAFPASLLAGLFWQGIGPWQGFGPAAPFYFGAIMAALAALAFFFWQKQKV